MWELSRNYNKNNISKTKSKLLPAIDRIFITRNLGWGKYIKHVIIKLYFNTYFPSKNISEIELKLIYEENTCDLYEFFWIKFNDIDRSLSPENSINSQK